MGSLHRVGWGQPTLQRPSIFRRWHCKDAPTTTWFRAKRSGCACAPSAPATKARDALRAREVSPRADRVQGWAETVRGRFNSEPPIAQKTRMRSEERRVG